MNDIEKARKEGHGFYTSIWDEQLLWQLRGLNARTALLTIGEEGDPKAPIAGVIQIRPGPGDPLRGRHLHHNDAINLVMEGAMFIDGHWLRPGQAKIIPSDFKYGDQITGEDGVIFLEIFADQAGAKPDYDDPSHQVYWNEAHGQYMFHE
jgi:hypothetical protein